MALSCFSAVYASTNYITRRDLWSDLSALQTSNPAPWCFIGDFNAILGAHEHRGNCLPSAISCDKFRSWSDLQHLIHINTRGVSYTWSNGRFGNRFTERRLDRSIYNEDWLNF